MQFERAKVDWREEWSHPPRLLALVDETPREDEFIWETDDRGKYWSVHSSGEVRIFYYEGPGTGFQKHTFHLNMKDGTERELIGPWSSRPSLFTDQIGEPAASIFTTKSSTYYKQAWSMRTMHLTLSRLAEVAALADVYLAEVPTASSHTGVSENQGGAEQVDVDAEVDADGDRVIKTETVIVPTLRWNIPKYRLSGKGDKITWRWVAPIETDWITVEVGEFNHVRRV